MKHLSKLELKKLSASELRTYLLAYSQELLEGSYTRCRDDDKLGTAAWPYRQASEIGNQKSLLRLINLLN